MPDQPNLVFIWTDEQVAMTTGAYRNDQVDTPNLDALADDSAVFSNAYASTPVCSPSRSCVMTGKYPHSTGVVENNVSLPPDEKCLPEITGFEDYTSCWIGKWHLGDEIFRQHGFDEWISTEYYRDHWSDDRDRNAVPDYHEFLVENGYQPDQVHDDGYEEFSRHFCTDLPEKYSKPAFMAQEARRFIHEHQNDPFILYVMFLEPHSPYFSPRDDQYDPDNIDLPPNFDHDGLAGQPLKPRLIRTAIQRGVSTWELETILGESPTEADWKRLIANYWGLASLVDTYAGTILDTLEECRLTSDTITVYTSDHGDMMGNHQLVYKNCMFEESIKVPLLLRVPDLTEDGKRIEAPVSQIDLLPTIIDAMDKSIPNHLQGGSWIPYLCDEGPLPRRDVIVEWNGPNALGMQGRHSEDVTKHEELLDTETAEVWEEIADRELILDVMTEPVRTIITRDGWKLNRRRSGEKELYNLSEDPNETEDLSDDPAQKDTIDDLTKRIFTWQRQTSDPIYF